MVEEHFHVLIVATFETVFVMDEVILKIFVTSVVAFVTSGVASVTLVVAEDPAVSFVTSVVVANDTPFPYSVHY